MNGILKKEPRVRVLHLSLATEAGKNAARAFHIEGMLPVSYLFDKDGQPLSYFNGPMVEADLPTLLSAHGLRTKS